VVWVDDTGWRVNARLQNLRVWLSEQVTVYVIEPHRGYAEAVAFLGEDYDGFLVHDGARCFYGLEQAFPQGCLEHLIRRCREMIQIASPAAAQFPLAVKTLLQQGLRLRDRYQQGGVPQGLAVATGRLEASLDRLLDRRFGHPANRRLAKHLRHELPRLFTFLRCPGLPATNHFAERAIRLMAIARKTWGGIGPPTAPASSRFWPACYAPAGSKAKAPLIIWSSYYVPGARSYCRSSLPNSRLEMPYELRASRLVATPRLLELEIRQRNHSNWHRGVPSCVVNTVQAFARFVLSGCERWKYCPKHVTPVIAKEARRTSIPSYRLGLSRSPQHYLLRPRLRRTVGSSCAAEALSIQRSSS
jgi:hypothetical protein